MLRKRFLTVSILVVGLLIASFFVGAYYNSYGGIGRNGYFVESSRSATETIVDEYLKGGETGQAPVTVQERMVVYNGYVSVETGDVQGTLTKIRTLAENSGGYVAGSSRTEGWAEITIRVPKEKFREAVQEIETYGKVLDEQTSSEDVTEQYIDVKARLENLQRQEKRLQEILDMAKTVDELLTVEREIERVRGEIESLQGQLTYLERNVTMSVITVHLTEPPQPFTPPRMDWKETFETALRALYAMVRGLVILAISIVPIAIIGAPVYYIYKRRRSRREATK
jgi:hypothetical protein